MSLRDGPLSDIKPPVAWLAVATLVLALMVSAVVFLGDRRGGHAASSPARRMVDTAVGQVTGFVSTPLRWAGGLTKVGGDYLFAASENRRLREDLAAARAWRDEALALREVNARYRALLGVATDPPIPMVFGRTVLDARGPFANTRIADVGAARGVVEGNPVMSEHGLVGRVTGVASGVSRIMLLTDVESRTPVLIPRINGRAILTGDGGPDPKLNYLRSHEAPREGDRVLTSGDGGVLPRGLPVGVVAKGFDGGWRVALDSDAAPIDFVQILLFKDFSQLTSPAALAPASLPSTATGAPVEAPKPMAASQTPSAQTPSTKAPSAQTPAPKPPAKAP